MKELDKRLKGKVWGCWPEDQKKLFMEVVKNNEVDLSYVHCLRHDGTDWVASAWSILPRYAYWPLKESLRRWEQSKLESDDRYLEVYCNFGTIVVYSEFGEIPAYKGMGVKLDGMDYTISGFIFGDDASKYSAVYDSPIMWSTPNSKHLSTNRNVSHYLPVMANKAVCVRYGYGLKKFKHV